MLERAAGRCRRTAGCSKAIPIDASETLGIDRRIQLGDRLAVDTLLAEVVDDLELLRDQMNELLPADGRVIARLDSLRRHKQTTGCDAVICGGRWINKDAGRTDLAGKEPQRSGTDRKRRRRATEGQLARGNPCSS